MSDNIKATSFRISETAIDKFKEFATEVNMTQREFFDSLINIYELESSKKTISKRGKEIEEFQQHAQRMVSIFLNSLELNQNAESIIEEKYRELLKKKSTALDSIQAQLEKKKNISNILNENKKTMEIELESLTKTNKQLEKINQNNMDLINQYKEKTSSLTKLVEDYKNYKVTIEKIQKSLNQKTEIAENQIHEIKNLNFKIENCEKQTEFYKKQISELKEEIKDCKNYEDIAKKEAKLEIKISYEKTKLEFEEKIKFIKEKQELESEKNIMILQKSYEETISNMKKTHLTEIENLKIKTNNFLSSKS